MTNLPILLPTDERDVEFYGDTITGLIVLRDTETTIYVPLRPICEYLGLTWSGQYERLKRDEVLAEGMQGVRVTRTPLTGGPQEMLCLPLDLLPGWLFGINAARVKPELREKILRERRECFRVLWDAFRPAILPPAPGMDASGAELAYQVAVAQANLAREHAAFEQRLTQAARWARATDDRLTALEVRLAPEQPITEAQAIDIHLAVRAVAHALEARGTHGAYQRVHGELWRTFGITSYRNLALTSYQPALDWLRAWYSQVTATPEA